MAQGERTSAEVTPANADNNTSWDELDKADETPIDNPEDTPESDNSQVETDDKGDWSDFDAPTEKDELGDKGPQYELIEPLPMEELPPGESPIPDELTSQEIGQVVGNRESAIKPDLKRLHNAVKAYEASVFDGKALSIADRALIARFGGEKFIKEQLELTLAQRYNEGQVISAYYANRGRISQREMWALTYWARQDGNKSVAVYAKERMEHYNNEKVRAIDIAVAQLRADGRFDPDYLTLDEADLVMDYKQSDLEFEACGRIYGERRAHTLAYLADHDRGEVKGSPAMQRDVDLAIRYLCEKRNCSPSELGEYYRNLANHIYYPNTNDFAETEAFVNGLIKQISQAEIDKAADSLGPDGKNYTAMIRALEHTFKKLFKLEKVGIKVIIDMSDDDKDGTLGFFSPTNKVLQINAKYIEKCMRRDYSKYSEEYIQAKVIGEIADTVAHELLHAYQEEYGRLNSDERSEMYVINGFDYVSPERGRTRYRDQTMERESFSIGSKIGNMVVSSYFNKKGGRR